MRPAPLIHFWPGRTDLPDPPPRGFPAFSFARGAWGPPTFDRTSAGLAIAAFAEVLVNPDRAAQRWEQAADDGHWIGVDQDADPDDFLRPVVLDGVSVLLADRQTWRLPRINPVLLTACDLPKQTRPRPTRVCPDAGRVLLRLEVDTVIAPEFADLAERARRLSCAMFDAVTGGQSSLALDDGELRQLLADTIAINYNLVPQEMMALGLFGPDTDGPAALAILAWNSVLESLAAVLCSATVPRVSPVPGVPAEVPHG